jgi:hypothetical protein
MATTPTFDHTLLTAPFSYRTDFTELADCCERFASTLVECDDPAEKLALYGRLSACLALLQPTLNEPVPPHLVAQLTAEDLPARLPAFAPESDELGAYCQSLTRLLVSQVLPPEMARVLEGLLCSLVVFYAEKLNAPRWLHTAQGRVLIDDLIH